MLICLVSGCQCDSSDVLAELIESTGSIDRDFAAKVGQWSAADMGAEFRVGDGVKSKKKSKAVLRLSGDTYVNLNPESVIRFVETLSQDKKKKAHGLDVETGEAELVVGESEVVLVTSVGRAILQSGTRIQLKKAAEGVELRVEIGEATFFDKDNNPNVMKAGEGILVDIGSAVLERYGQEPKDTGEEKRAELDTGQPEAVEEDEEKEEKAEASSMDFSRKGAGPKEAVSVPDGPDYADFAVSAGQSFILHVAKPPASVELRFEGKCDRGAAVDVKKRFVSKGTESANVLLKTGRQPYRVHCLDEEGHPKRDIAAKGSILVLRDSGVARLPNSAASTYVETDGRRYKIMYQTRIPNVSVRWPRAPKGQKYVLHIGKRKIKTKKPSYSFSSGELSEGTHQIKYEAIGDLSRTSKTTTVDIRFDNAAPKATISAPKEGGFAPGSRVQVSGVAVANWKVSVVGGNIEMDSQHRFNGETVHSAKYRAIALRLSHGKRGIHYYLRRASGTSE